MADSSGRDATCYWTAGRAELLRATLKDRGYGLHSHPTLVLGVIESGVEDLALRREETAVARAGDIVVLNPDTAHTGVAVGPEPVRYRAFYLPQSLVDDALDEGHHAFAVGVYSDQSVADLLRDVHVRLETITGSAADRYLIDLLHRLRKLCGHKSAECAEDTDPRVAAARAILLECLEAPPRLADLAARVGLSKCELARRFASRYQLPPLAYANEHRIRRATAMLADGATIIETSQLLGYSDQAHMTRAFKKARGITPGYYSRVHKQATQGVLTTAVVAT